MFITVNVYNVSKDIWSMKLGSFFWPQQCCILWSYRSTIWQPINWKNLWSFLLLKLGSQFLKYCWVSWGLIICTLHTIASNVWRVLNPLMKILCKLWLYGMIYHWGLSDTVYHHMFQSLEDIITKESCPDLLHERFHLQYQYYYVTYTFPCTAYPNTLKQLDLRPYQEYGLCKSCCWLNRRPLSVQLPLYDWFQPGLQESTKKLPSKHLVLEKGPWLSGPSPLCLNQGCSISFVDLFLSLLVLACFELYLLRWIATFLCFWLETLCP